MPDRRKPQHAPSGPISTENQPNDDIMLLPALFTDAVQFVAEARLMRAEGNVAREERDLRAALYAAFAYFEAQINFLAFTHAKVHVKSLSEVERDILEGIETRLDDKGYLARQTRFYPMEARFLFLTLYLSGQGFDQGSELWGRFKWAKGLRDTWTHPKPPFDTWSLTVEDVEMSVLTVREVVVELARMMGANPPPWLAEFSPASWNWPAR